MPAEPLDLPTFSSPARRDAWGKQAMVHGSKAWKQAAAVVVRNTTRMSRSQLREIMRRALAKYQYVGHATSLPIPACLAVTPVCVCVLVAGERVFSRAKQWELWAHTRLVSPPHR